MRIVSLLPSCTEIVCRLGLRRQLVGRSHECDEPTDVAALPACTRSKLDSRAGSHAIDTQVKQLLQNALSIYEIDAALLRSLKPDLILTQAQCEVCAVSLDDVQALVRDELNDSATVVSLQPSTVGGILDSIETVAQAANVAPAGKALRDELFERMHHIAQRAANRARTPVVACIEWLDPLMNAGNWVPELVTMAGAAAPFGQTGEHSSWLSFEQLAADTIDQFVLMPCGFGLDRCEREYRDTLLQSKAWNALPAVRSGRVALADGNGFFNRPGPRIVESLEILAEIAHPDEFDFGHRGRHWKPAR